MTRSPPATPADAPPARLPHPERAIFVFGLLLAMTAAFVLVEMSANTVRVASLTVALLPGLAWGLFGGARTREVVVAAMFAVVAAGYGLIAGALDGLPPFAIDSAAAASLALAIESQRRLDAAGPGARPSDRPLLGLWLGAAALAVGCLVRPLVFLVAIVTWGAVVTVCIRMLLRRFSRPPEAAPVDATALAVALARARLALLGLAAASLVPLAEHTLGVAPLAATGVAYAGHAAALLVLAVAAWRFRAVVGAAHGARIAAFWALAGGLHSAVYAALVTVGHGREGMASFFAARVFGAAAVLALALVVRSKTPRAGWRLLALAALPLLVHVFYPLIRSVVPAFLWLRLVEVAAWLALWWLARPAVAHLRDEGLASAFGPTR